MGVALLAGWLSVSAAARAQAPGAPGPDSPLPPAYAPASADVPPHGFPEGMSHAAPVTPPAPAPGGPGPEMGTPCPPSGGPQWNGPIQHPECLPDNSFSNIHPEQTLRSPRFYLEADYLMWWVRRDLVPPLLTTGSLGDSLPGALGQPGTAPLVGPGSFGPNSSSGARVSAFFWNDQDHTIGLDVNAFWLQEQSSNNGGGGIGDPRGPVIARPFFNPNTGIQDADPVVVPGVQSGALAITFKRRFMGADTNLRWAQCSDFGPFTRVTFLTGGRFLYLDEKLLFNETINDLPDTSGVPANSVLLHDGFVTYNRFYGGQVGLETETRVGPLVFTLTGKVAVGETTEQVKISGGTTVTEPGVGVTSDPTRGLLVQPTNFGRHNHDQFGVVPEAAASLAWEFNEHLRVSVGYNFLWWSQVMRPGEQIDTTVNVGAVGGAVQPGTSPHPLVPLHTSAFWAQGLSAGVQVSY
jgi:hypothetical protein